MYGSHKIIPHTIKRAIQSQCFIDAYCPATVTAESQGTDTDAVGLYGYGPGLAGKITANCSALAGHMNADRSF